MARPKKSIKLKEPVRIREKKLKDGNISLYLDIYYKGVRKYEFLNLILIPETTPLAKFQNAQTRQVAEKIKSERVLSIQDHGIDKWSSIKKASMPLTRWLTVYEGMTLGVKPKTIAGRKKMHRRVDDFLEESNRTSIALNEVDRDFCRDFIKYLSETTDHRYDNEKDNKPKLSVSSAHCYFAIFTGALNKAVREGIIPSSPVKTLDSKERPQAKEGSKKYLTIEELKKLENTPCSSPELKTAFLFACFTGLRLSDMRKLTNRDIQVSADGKTRYIYTEMTKTGGTVSIPLSAEALKYLPDEEDDDALLFHIQQNATALAYHLNKWVKAAGIKKHITFHCSRHTFGTLMLTLGADIYTTSKLMGHSNVKTTEVYAKIVDKKRVDAINLMDNMFDKLEN